MLDHATYIDTKLKTMDKIQTKIQTKQKHQQQTKRKQYNNYNTVQKQTIINIINKTNHEVTIIKKRIKHKQNNIGIKIN